MKHQSQPYQTPSRIRSVYDFERKAEKVDKTSRTIPDDSFTIKDLFDRYQKGQPMPLGIERPIAYGENADHNDLDMNRINRLDIAEISDLRTRVAATHQALIERQKALQEAQNDDKTTKKADKEAPPVQ